MKSLLAVTAIAALLSASSIAAAQTANSSPSAPAPGGMTGTPPATSTIGPSGGRADTGAAKPSQIGPQTETEKKEQQKSDQDMTICKGC